METMRALIFIAGLTLFLGYRAVYAAEVTLTWDLPTTYCDGTALDATRLGTLEIYWDTNPIPGPAAEDPDCPETALPAPEGFAPIAVPAGQTQVKVDVDPGQTYYARVRVSDTDGNWSSLTKQISTTIPFAMPRAPAVFTIQLN